jgi:hypothetical protein
MRASLTLFSLVTLMLTPFMAQAQSGPQSGQWSVRPAPQSWGLPQQGAPRVFPDSQQPQYQAPQQNNSNTTMSQAVTCAAALQLATMAAPTWAGERGITNITNAWLQKVFALSESQGISGDRVPALVESEMQRQVDQAANDPDTLSRRAFDCASRQP